VGDVSSRAGGDWEMGPDTLPLPSVDHLVLGDPNAGALDCMERMRSVKETF
jgi:hypothetical protein